jgi:hypothetical protein
MLTLGLIKRRLAAISPLGAKGTLVRLVPFVAVTNCEPVDWLYTSGKPNRYNPEGVECVYCGENEATARAEYDDFWSGVTGAMQPLVTYHVKVRLSAVLDLTSRDVLRLLGLKPGELLAPWRKAKKPTLTQLIGLAIQEGATFSAIRYSSRGCERRRL